jgi:type II pantothenate kinase
MNTLSYAIKFWSNGEKVYSYGMRGTLGLWGVFEEAAEENWGRRNSFEEDVPAPGVARMRERRGEVREDD